MAIAMGVNGKFVQPSVVYRWRWSFFTTSQSSLGRSWLIFSTRDGRDRVLWDIFCHR